MFVYSFVLCSVKNAFHRTKANTGLQSHTFPDCMHMLSTSLQKGRQRSCIVSVIIIKTGPACPFTIFPLSSLHYQIPYFSEVLHRSPSPAQHHTKAHFSPTKNRPMWGDTLTLVNTLWHRWTILWWRRRTYINTKEWPLYALLISSHYLFLCGRAMCSIFNDAVKFWGQLENRARFCLQWLTLRTAQTRCDKGHSGYKYLQWSWWSEEHDATDIVTKQTWQSPYMTRLSPQWAFSMTLPPTG